MILPDGRRCWMLDDRVEYESDSAAGFATIPVAGNPIWLGTVGFGLVRIVGRISTHPRTHPPTHRRRVFDVTRQREFAVPAEFAGQVLVLPQEWLCCTSQSPDQSLRAWWLFDPVSGARRPARLRPTEQVLAVLRDGRVVTREIAAGYVGAGSHLRHRMTGAKLSFRDGLATYLVDPAQGTRLRLEPPLADGTGARLSWVQGQDLSKSGRATLWFQDQGQTYVVRLDLATGTLSGAIPVQDSRVSEGRGGELYELGQVLTRVDPDTGERVTLFPKGR